MRTFALRAVAALAAATAPFAAQAATIEIVNRNTGTTGFSDPSPANAVAGANGAATLGEQRLAVIRRAAQIWGQILHSDVPIRVAVQMVDQDCGDDGTTLASAGPVDLAANFPNAPRADTAYHIALANSLAGRDLVPERDDIVANFNLRIDAGCRDGTAGWWYGLDPEAPVPADRIALLPVALHELAHGLGFSAQVNLDTGRYAGSAPPVWANFLYDLALMRHWRAMTAAERATSARNDPHLVWSGSHVNGQSRQYLTGAPVLRMNRGRDRGVPEEITTLGSADFGAPFPDAPLEARVVQVNDGVAANIPEGAGTIRDGCEFPFRNGERLAGAIALVDRGLCPFVDKARHAQQHGAIAVIVVNNVEGDPPGMAGADPTITIPVVSVRREEGARMRRDQLRPQLRIAFGQTGALAGTTQGCVRMYAPAESEPGSSVSHFHRAAFPDLLMEPSITRGQFDDLDLTIPLFLDIGWNRGSTSFPPPNPCQVRPLP